MNWYYSKNGMQLGPVAEEELLAKSKSGEVSVNDLIWKEGMADWKPLGQVEEFMGSLPVSMSPPSSQVSSVPIPKLAPMNPNQVPGVIPNYLWQSIVATVLCCMPFGVVSIIYAAKVDGLVARGDIVGATAASKSAKTWVTASVVSWLVGVVLYIVLGADLVILRNLN